MAIEFDGQVKYRDPWRDPGRVLWEEKRREDAVRALGIRFVRLADRDVDAGWAPSEERVRGLLASPGPAVRDFVVVRRDRGRVRTA